MQRLKLLMVDDDLEDQEMFGMALQETAIPVQVEFTSNGREALEKLKASKNLPDIVFCDINMPVMNGVQFLEEVKKSSELSLIPVVMYTTSSSEMYKSQCKKLGAAHYIIKPSCFSKMCQEIRNSFMLLFDLSFKQQAVTPPFMHSGK